ncbi:lisH domain-containing protein ARMC9 isoform X2 [Halyomorpha halys]|uniref:lisH domain-containing protein ARMC9 isoform X2 n=1 Tax=Halyomorpha halys TaxID=286706 RepID=UPI0034D19711
MSENIVMDEFNECAETESFCVQLVYEFLVCYNFSKTVNVFIEEIQSSSYSLPEKRPNRKDRIERVDALEMISCVNTGNHLHFFRNWTDLIPRSIKDEREYENITVLLHAYFATLPMREDVPRTDHIVVENSNQIDDKNKTFSEFTKYSENEKNSESIKDNKNETYAESTKLKTAELISDAKILEEVEAEEPEVQTENKKSDKENVDIELKIEMEESKTNSGELEIADINEEIVTKDNETHNIKEGNDDKEKEGNDFKEKEGNDFKEKEGNDDKEKEGVIDKEQKFRNLRKVEIKIDNLITNSDKNKEIKNETIEEQSVFKENEIKAMGEEKMNNKETNLNHPTAMQMFKNYLLENKYRFSSETEYLPLFALPFIENPKEHLAYSEVFKEKWVRDLKSALKSFLIKYSCGETVVPQIVNMCNERKRSTALLKKYEASAEDSMKRYHETKAKLHKLKRDHKQLVGVATELATALENSVRGQAVDLNTTLLKCASIFPDVFPHTFTASNEGLKEISDKKTLQFSPMHLDIKKIKEDLSSSSMKTKLLLLQALRWYTCSLTSDERPQVVHWLRCEDVLGLSTGGLTQQWLQSPAHPLQQALARWLNLLCSLRCGRGYVESTSASLLPLVIRAVCRPEQDPVTRDMLLASLQKLSLRKELCETMVEEGLLEWLGQELPSMNNDYTLQYCTSLFMNLSFVAPLSFWDTRPHQVLPGLISLLKSSNEQIQQFVCGSLYCLLRSDKLNIFARSINLSAELAMLSSSPLKRQVEALMRLHQRVHSSSAAQITAQCTDREMDDPEEIEPEINNNDLVKGTPSGEELLFQKYSVVFTAPCIVDREQERQKIRSNSNLPAWAQ